MPRAGTLGAVTYPSTFPPAASILARADADSYRKLAAEYRIQPEVTSARMWNNMIKKVSPNLRVQIVPDASEPIYIGVKSRKPN